MMKGKAYLEPEEVSRLEGIPTNLRDRVMVRFISRTGCRVSEALALSPADIDFEQGTVTIPHLKHRHQISCPYCSGRLSRESRFCQRCGEKVTEALSEEKEHRRQRTIPVDKGTLGLLREYVDRGGAVDYRGKKRLFGINRHRAWQIIRDCADKAGLPKLINQETGKVHGVSPHRLRDAFAVRAVKRDDSGDGLRLLQEHLGHASFNTTAKYRKVSGQEQRAWYDKLWTEDNSNG